MGTRIRSLQQTAGVNCQTQLFVLKSHMTQAGNAFFTTISIPDLHPTFSPFICISRHILSAYDSAHEGRQPHEWI